MQKPEAGDVHIELARPTLPQETYISNQRSKLSLFLERTSSVLCIDCERHAMIDRDVLALLVQISREAKQNGKQVRLINVSPGVAKILSKHQHNLPLEFVERAKPQSKKKKKASTQTRILMLAVVSVCSIPAIILVDRFFFADVPTPTVGNIKSTEIKSHEELGPRPVFRIMGSIRFLNDGNLAPDPEATIVVVPESKEIQIASIATRSQPDGNYLIEIPAIGQSLRVQVIIVSGRCEQGDVQPDVTVPVIDKLKSPAAKSVSQLCFPNQPVVVDALFY